MTTSPVHAAVEEFLHRGWRPIPIPPGAKGPVLRNWQSLHVTLADIPRLFVEPTNVGVILGAASGGLVDIDLDWPEAAALADRLMPATGAVFGRSGKPRSHRLYRSPGIESTAVQHPAPPNGRSSTMVEIRADDRQTVFPPSVHPSGEAIQWDGALGEPADLEAEDLNHAVALVALGCLLLAAWTPGQRDELACAIARVLLDAGQTEGDIEPFVVAVAEVAGDEEVVIRGRKARAALRARERGRRFPGFPTLRRLLGNPVAAEVSELLTGVSGADAAIDRLNEKHAAALDGGKLLIFRQVLDQDTKPPVERWETIGPDAFRLFYNNRGIWVAGRQVPLGTAWLAHPRRREYQRVVFAPNSPADPEVLNLWSGFAVQPAPGDWTLLKAHLRDVLCGGDDEKYDYLLRWLARAMQHPELPGETAIVLRGRKGIGKGLVGGALVRLFGAHGMRIQAQKHLVGSFNAHLRTCAFLYADEAFWAGDKAAESVLKGLITDAYTAYEPKGRDVVAGRNRVTLLMASNAEWVVPATFDERRFVVLDVRDTHRNDRAYFGALKKSIEQGPALAAMLHELLQIDLSDFNPQALPRTRGLREQIVASLDPVSRWWYERLMTGEVIDAEFGLPDGWEPSGDWATTGTEVPFETLHRDYLHFAEQHRVAGAGRGHRTRTELGVCLSRWLPAGWPRRTRPTRNVAPWDNLTRRRADHRPSDRRQIPCYRLPSLDECRRAFTGRAPGEADSVQSDLFDTGDRTGTTTQ